jgi:hypothetical protein
MIGSARSICVQDVDDRDESYCVRQCARNQDCVEGLTCALYPDRSVDRSVSICREPLGPGGADTTCTTLTECASGVCATVAARTERFCSEFCSSTRDCPAALPRCLGSSIPKPINSAATDTLSICLP